MNKKKRAQLKASAQRIAETRPATEMPERKKAGRKATPAAKAQTSATSSGKARVGIIMGSSSDLPVMQEAADILAAFGVATEVAVVSAHRTPDAMMSYARTARERGLSVIIAGAGGAAHLPGMVAAITTLPVIGVPIKSSNSIDGWDSILSILQMPAGIPVATVALNGARNAGILAASILGTSDATVAAKLDEYKQLLIQKVKEMNASLI